MENLEHFKNINNRSGQSAVEYIMLLAVVALLVFTILQSNTFKSFFGSDSEITKKYADYMEYTYRHGRPGSKDKDRKNYSVGGIHETYQKDGSSRFFIVEGEYPEN